jgi:hypothetical protein
MYKHICIYMNIFIKILKEEICLLLLLLLLLLPQFFISRRNL